MAKTMILTLLLTWTPGYVLWVTLAGLALALWAAAEEWALWRERAERREPGPLMAPALVPIRVDRRERPRR